MIQSKFVRVGGSEKHVTDTLFHLINLIYDFLIPTILIILHRTDNVLNPLVNFSWVRMYFASINYSRLDGRSSSAFATGLSFQGK